jgi:Raf kinase inhibitor-like YbhB/YbcL family protein
MKGLIGRLAGRLLRGVHAGERHLAWNDARLAAPATLGLSSPDFADGGTMPWCCAGVGVGDNLSPALAWHGVPAGAAELVLLMEDPDAPLRRPVVHLIAHGLPGRDGGVPAGGLAEGGLAEGGLAEGEMAEGAAIAFGRGFRGRRGYAGPRPPPGHGPHRYIFSLFALAGPLDAGASPDLAAVRAAMAGRVIARGRLSGSFERV